MKFALITHDDSMVETAKKGFHPSDELIVFAQWQEALAQCEGVDLMFVDLIATLDEPHKIAGYEAFANAKLADPKASTVPLVLISPEPDYDLDFFVGFPDFVVGNLPRPVTEKLFRRASTWV